MEVSQDEQAMTIQDIIITQRTLVGRVEESEIPDSQFGDRYDFTATIGSEEQFYTDVNAIYEKVLGRTVSPTDYTFESETRLPA